MHCIYVHIPLFAKQRRGLGVEFEDCSKGWSNYIVTPIILSKAIAASLGPFDS